MKKLILVFLSLGMLFSLTGCKSKEERELEKAYEALEKSQQAADNAWADYYQLQKDIERYESLRDMLN